MDRVPVWLDCDPGHDDAIAILLASGSPKLQLLGISTVSGNQSVDKTTCNAVRMVEAAGQAGLPVYRGAGKPLLRPAKHDPGIHGETGLDGSEVIDALPYREPPPRDLGEVLAEVRRAMKGAGRTVDVIATGALTNIALLYRLYPDLLSVTRQIVLMGGAVGMGNRHPVAEFNILCDPEAAAIVFDLPVKVVMVPLEVTHTALVTLEVESRITRELHGSPLSKAVLQLMTFFRKTYSEEFGFSCPPLHDPCAVAYCIAPHLFQATLMRVDVVTGEHLTSGQTVCDVWGISPRPKNVYVARKMDVQGFWDTLVDALVRCNAVSPLGYKKRLSGAKL